MSLQTPMARLRGCVQGNRASMPYGGHACASIGQRWWLRLLVVSPLMRQCTFVSATVPSVPFSPGQLLNLLARPSKESKALLSTGVEHMFLSRDRASSKVSLQTAAVDSENEMLADLQAVLSLPAAESSAVLFRGLDACLLELLAKTSRIGYLKDVAESAAFLSALSMPTDQGKRLPEKLLGGPREEAAHAPQLCGLRSTIFPFLQKSSSKKCSSPHLQNQSPQHRSSKTESGFETETGIVAPSFRHFPLLRLCRLSDPKSANSDVVEYLVAPLSRRRSEDSVVLDKIQKEPGFENVDILGWDELLISGEHGIGDGSGTDKLLQSLETAAIDLCARKVAAASSAATSSVKNVVVETLKKNRVCIYQENGSKARRLLDGMIGLEDEEIELRRFRKYHQQALRMNPLIALAHMTRYARALDGTVLAPFVDVLIPGLGNNRETDSGNSEGGTPGKTSLPVFLIRSDLV